MSLITPTYSISGSLGLGRTLALLGGILLAVFLGLLATTAKPAFIALGVGLLIGGMLLTKPTWIIWLVMVLGLLVVGVIGIWVDGSKAEWGVSLLGFMLMLMALFKVISAPEAVRETPAFVWVALVFILYAVLNSIVHLSPAYEFFSGFKRFFQVAGLMFALAWFSFTEKQVRRWQVFFIVVALIQLPWALYELVKLVPIRESLVNAYPGLVPIDVVAGTFGASLYSGGASGDMATFLIVMLAFILARRREKLLGFGKCLYLLSFVLVPLFLGETKVVLILLPIMFLTLYRREFIARPHIALAGLALGVVLTVGAGYAYMGFSKKSNSEDELASTLSYNVYEGGYGNYALNRTTALTFWVERQGLHDPVSTVFGNGLGAAHIATSGHVSRRYPGYGIGLTAASTLLWEQGLLGTALFMSTLALAWRTAGQLRRGAVQSWIRADAAAIQAAIALFAVHLIYTLSLMELLSFQVFFFTLLGYTALLYRHHISSTACKNSINIKGFHVDQDWKRRTIC